MRTIVPLFLTVVLLVLAGVQWSVCGPTLPEKIALHFNGAGIPDNFGPKEMLFKIEFGVMLFITFLFQIMSGFIRLIPDAFINLPNKDYWLAPERRNQTLGTIGGMMAWGGVLTNAFLLVVFQLVIQAHRSVPPKLDNELFIGLLIGFVAISTVGSLAVMNGFRRRD